MKHLIHTFISTSTDGSTLKYEIYSDYQSLDFRNKIQEGTCQVISSKFFSDINQFKVTDIDLNIDSLFKANQPKPNTVYFDGQDRVSLDMLISHLDSLN